MDNRISIGRRLKEAREKKPLTIEQVQKQTKIHSSVLKALEEGRASELLTDTYVRSFLKQYSNLLGLPTADILKEYFPPRQESPSLSMPFDENPLPYETKVGPKALYFTGIAILGIVVVLAAVLIVGKAISSLNRAALTRHDKRIAAASAARNKQPKAVKSAQKKKSPQKAGSSSKELIPRPEKIDLVIKVKEPVLVTLKRDGVTMYSVIMKKGTVDRVAANENIELDVLNTGALDLTLNGRQVSLPSRNNARGVIITRKGVWLK